MFRVTIEIKSVKTGRGSAIYRQTLSPDQILKLNRYANNLLKSKPKEEE